MNRTQILYFFALVLCPLFAVGQGTFSKLPKADKAIYGTLDNGLNYIIHPTPQQKTEYRLVLNVGSLQERDNEKGYAHFLEHMIFNGSTDFPNHQAVDTLQRLGYRFGRDINAYTTYERTVYELSLLDDKQLDLAVNILANFLGKAQLNLTDIEKERKIVIQEIKDYGTESTFNLKKLEGSQQAHRLPVSTEENIIGLDPIRLKAFYQQWYSPSLATIIITGNVDPTVAKEYINKHFSTLKGNAKLDRKQSERNFTPSFDKALEIVNNKEANTNKLEIIRFTDAPFLATKEEFKQQIIEQLYKQWLNKKLSQANSQANAHSTWYLPSMNENAIEVTVKNKEELAKRISLVASVLNTMSTKGIHKEELERYKQDVLTHAVPSEEVDATYLANAYIDEVVVNSHYISPRDKHLLLTEVLSEITKDDVLIKHNNTWATNSANLYLLTANDSLGNNTTVDELNTYWSEGATQTLIFKKKKQKKEQHRARGTFSWKAMPSISKDHTSSVIKEQRYTNIGVTELTLSNGLRIGIKPTQANDDNFILTVFTRNGLGQIPVNQRKYYQDASYFIDSAWINGLTQDGYMQVGSDREVSTLVSLSNEASIVNTSSRIGNTKDLFEWTYRKMYDYIEPTQDFKEYIAENTANIGTAKQSSSLLNNPSIQIQHQIEEYKKGAPVLSEELTTTEDWQQLSLENFFSLYNNAYANLADNYVLISGNFDIDEIKAKAIHYFGHLQSKQTMNISIDNNAFKSPVKEIKRITLNSADIERTDATLVFRGIIAPTLKESIIAQMARELFNNHFLLLSREKEGLVYSPSSDVEVSIYPNPKTAVSLFFSASLEDLDKLEDLAIEVIKTIQSKPISTADLEQMKLAILNNKKLHLTESSTYQWIEKLREVQLNFGSLSDFDKYEEILHSITPEDVKNTAKTMFSTDSYGVFLVTPK